MWNRILKLEFALKANNHLVRIATNNFCTLPKSNNFVSYKTLPRPNLFCFVCVRTFYNSVTKLSDDIPPLQLKKRPVRKKLPIEIEDVQKPGIYNVVAFSTADEYNLEALKNGLQSQNLYEPKKIENLPDVLLAVAKYQLTEEPREILFFREGSVVFWNISDSESSNMIKFLREYEQDSYSETLIQGEIEAMKYKHQVEGKSLIIQSTGEMYIAPKDNILEKYTFSNTLASSVKLGIWEATLDRFIDSIEYISKDLQRGAKIKMSIDEVLTKHGELYGLRHLINLSSDLLDTPDFYWEHEELERLYSNGYAYFSIGRRTKVINEKINHCIELIELLSRHVSDRHHIRLEWMIIGLIMAEVGFETIHYIERYLS